MNSCPYNRLIIAVAMGVYAHIQLGELEPARALGILMPHIFSMNDLLTLILSSLKQVKTPEVKNIVTGGHSGGSFAIIRKPGLSSRREKTIMVLPFPLETGAWQCFGCVFIDTPFLIENISLRACR
jgi:hypothetical protein